jgi:cytochrome P450
METRPPLALDEIKFSDVEFWGLPLDLRYQAYKTLRDERPIAHFEEPEITGTSMPLPPGTGYFAVTRHADVVAMSRQPEIFCSRHGATSTFDMPPVFLEFFGSMINLDNPRHARLRRIVNAAFTPRRVQRIDDEIHRAATSIVDDVIERGECDFVTDVAARLPLRIICDMMGIAEADHDFVFERSNVILGATDPEYVSPEADIVMAILSAGSDLAQLVTDLAAHRVDHPADDLTTALVSANVDGEQLTHEELASFFILLVVAGNETTRNAISHTLVALDEHPDQRAIWAADVEGVTPTAIEEIVRWSSPVTWMRRTLAADHEYDGHQFHEGDKVLLIYASANRDERAFEDPERFDVRRQPNEHVGFGGYGPHYCLGAHLARREIGVMYAELFARVPDIRPSAEPKRLLSSFINGIKHLPCEFTPGRRRAA